MQHLSFFSGSTYLLGMLWTKLVTDVKLTCAPALQNRSQISDAGEIY